MSDICIVAAKRTPIGTFNGFAKNISTIQLGEIALRHTLNAINFFTTELDPNASFPVFFGCVLSAGLGQNPARQVALNAGLSNNIMTNTINHVCASGLTSVIYAYDKIATGFSPIAIAGGMENMSQAPYLLMNARNGYRLGHNELIDHVTRDGLEDATSHKTMLWLADQMCKEHHISRAEMEDFAQMTFEKAQAAMINGFFNEEIATIKTIVKNKPIVIDTDEHIQKVKPDKFAQLPPIFQDGMITAATASPIADGAACTLLSTLETAQTYHWPVLAIIKDYAYVGTQPEHFTYAPVLAIQKLCQKIGWSVEDVDLFEINEAFAMVPILVHRQLNIPFDKINVNGGACVLGHPLGCSGTRILVTLIHNLRRLGKKRGIASICIGGGEGAAIAIEIPDPSNRDF